MGLWKCRWRQKLCYVAIRQSLRHNVIIRTYYCCSEDKLFALISGCPTNEVDCDSSMGPCIPNLAVCNGTSECPNGFDESNCEDGKLFLDSQKLLHGCFTLALTCK